MTFLTNAIANFKAHNTSRLPVTTSRGGVSGLLDAFVQGGTSRTAELQSMSASAWLFSTINVIGTGLSSARWQVFLKETGRGAEREEVFGSPALMLWNDPSPFYTRPEFNKLISNHYSSTGEMWMVKIRDQVMGLPIELQPVRPDRMFPIPSPDEFLVGYEYRLGSERIPLDLDDVIYTRNPHPTDPYRGISPISSITLDIASEKSAAAWTASAFQNDATPGGVLEFEETLDDDQFDNVMKHWRESHRGVNNARRIAVLERGKYKAVSFSPRDMQMNDLRHLNRDLILGAFGMPKAMLGITEDVNRANAEAAEVVFARWILEPLLTLLEASLNQYLIPEFNDREEFAFVDPVPANREADSRDAITGYKNDVLTLNEARLRMREGSVPDGDMFRRELTPAPAPNGGGVTLEAVPIKALPAAKAEDNPLYPDDVNREESAMERGWRLRLEQEADDIADFLEQFIVETSFDFDGDGKEKTRRSVLKLEPSDIEGYDWKWAEKYGAAVEVELASAFTEAALAEFPLMDPPALQQLASTFARDRGAQLLRLTGDESVMAATRGAVNDLVSEAILNGDSLQTIQRSLRDDFMFSTQRAERVARTETATALGQGQKGAALEQGRNQKRWRTQGDANVSRTICAPNARQDWIGVTQTFQSNHDTIPGHVNCRCNVVYRTVVEEVYCPTCEKRMPVNGVVLRSDQDGPQVYCRFCKETFEVTVF